VVVGKIPDQWFIRYSDEELTEKSVEHAEQMTIKPQSYADNLPSTIEWFKDRSCARKGNWMGTEFPFDEEWVIEAIADSTLYPAYYIIARYYNEGEIKAEQMNEDFFDFVLLGEGKASDVAEKIDVPKGKLEEIRSDFEYWYPLDLNLGGKEHMTVHFPVFLMNHVGLLEEGDRPRGIFVNWWLVGRGGKISKSKGGAEPIPDAAEKYGVDTLRLFYAHSASPFVDKDWNEEEAFNYKKKLSSLVDMMEKVWHKDGEEKKEKKIDDYLRSRFNGHLKEYHYLMDRYEIRKGANIPFYEIPSEIYWYLKRGGENGELLNEVGEKLVKMMTPFTPHVAEELSERWDIEFVTEAALPVPDEEMISRRAEVREEYIKKVQDDIQHILDIAEVDGNKIYIYIAEEWKEKALEKVKENPDRGMGVMGDLVDEIDAPSDELSSFVQKALEDVKKRKEEAFLKADIHEKGVLEESKAYLEEAFETEVEVREAGKEDIYDPKEKASQAKPYRPAIYIE
ncbi:MAG: class I tRNA ligase family protein, partial [Candidatus Natronoplasma sp.]